LLKKAEAFIDSGGMKKSEKDILEKMMTFMKERNAEAFKRASFVIEILKST
jgi:predicted GTPase